MIIDTREWPTPLTHKQETLVGKLYDQLGSDGDRFLNNLKRSVTPTDTSRLISAAIQTIKERNPRPTDKFYHGWDYEDYDLWDYGFQYDLF